MEETEAVREVHCPSATVVVADLDEKPPLEEDEAIAELDAVIDKCRNCTSTRHLRTTGGEARCYPTAGWQLIMM